MATLGIIISFAMVSLLYGRDIYEDSASVFFMLCSITIFALGGLHSWLMMMLPILPGVLEAIFRLPGFKQRQGSWLLFMLLPGVAIALLQFFQVSLFKPWFLSVHPALMLCLELKTHSLPALLHSKSEALRWSNLLAAAAATVAVLLGQYGWLKTTSPQWNYLFAISLGLGLLHQGAIWAQRQPALQPFARVFKQEIYAWLLPLVIIWGAMLLSPPL